MKKLSQKIIAAILIVNVVSSSILPTLALAQMYDPYEYGYGEGEPEPTPIPYEEPSYSGGAPSVNDVTDNTWNDWTSTADPATYDYPEYYPEPEYTTTPVFQTPPPATSGYETPESPGVYDDYQYPPQPTPQSYQPTCPDGFYEVSGECYSNGQFPGQIGSPAGPEPVPTPAQFSCPAGFYEVSPGECYTEQGDFPAAPTYAYPPAPTPVACPYGYYETYGECVPYPQVEQPAPTTFSCPEGFYEVSGECYSNGQFVSQVTPIPQPYVYQPPAASDYEQPVDPYIYANFVYPTPVPIQTEWQYTGYEPDPVTPTNPVVPYEWEPITFPDPASQPAAVNNYVTWTPPPDPAYDFSSPDPGIPYTVAQAPEAADGFLSGAWRTFSAFPGNVASTVGGAVGGLFGGGAPVVPDSTDADQKLKTGIANLQTQLTNREGNLLNVDQDQCNRMGLTSKVDENGIYLGCSSGFTSEPAGGSRPLTSNNDKEGRNTPSLPVSPLGGQPSFGLAQPIADLSSPDQQKRLEAAGKIVNETLGGVPELADKGKKINDKLDQLNGLRAEVGVPVLLGVYNDPSLKAKALEMPEDEFKEYARRTLAFQRQQLGIESTVDEEGLIQKALKERQKFKLESSLGTDIKEYEAEVQTAVAITAAGVYAGPLAEEGLGAAASLGAKALKKAGKSLTREAAAEITAAEREGARLALEAKDPVWAGADDVAIDCTAAPVAGVLGISTTIADALKPKKEVLAAVLNPFCRPKVAAPAAPAPQKPNFEEVLDGDKGRSAQEFIRHDGSWGGSTGQVAPQYAPEVRNPNRIHEITPGNVEAVLKPGSTYNYIITDDGKVWVGEMRLGANGRPLTDEVKHIQVAAEAWGVPTGQANSAASIGWVERPNVQVVRSGQVKIDANGNAFVDPLSGTFSDYGQYKGSSGWSSNPANLAKTAELFESATGVPAQGVANVGGIAQDAVAAVAPRAPPVAAQVLEGGQWNPFGRGTVIPAGASLATAAGLVGVIQLQNSGQIIPILPTVTPANTATAKPPTAAASKPNTPAPAKPTEVNNTGRVVPPANTPTDEQAAYRRQLQANATATAQNPSGAAAPAKPTSQVVTGVGLTPDEQKAIDALSANGNAPSIPNAPRAVGQIDPCLVDNIGPGCGAALPAPTKPTTIVAFTPSGAVAAGGNVGAGTGTSKQGCPPGFTETAPGECVDGSGRYPGQQVQAPANPNPVPVSGPLSKEGGEPALQNLSDYIVPTQPADILVNASFRKDCDSSLGYKVNIELWQVGNKQYTKPGAMTSEWCLGEQVDPDKVPIRISQSLYPVCDKNTGAEVWMEKWISVKSGPYEKIGAPTGKRCSLGDNGQLVTTTQVSVAPPVPNPAPAIVPKPAAVPAPKPASQPAAGSPTQAAPVTKNPNLPVTDPNYTCKVNSEVIANCPDGYTCKQSSNYPAISTCQSNKQSMKSTSNLISSILDIFVKGVLAQENNGQGQEKTTDAFSINKPMSQKDFAVSLAANQAKQDLLSGVALNINNIKEDILSNLFIQPLGVKTEEGIKVTTGSDGSVSFDGEENNYKITEVSKVPGTNISYPEKIEIKKGVNMVYLAIHDGDGKVEKQSGDNLVEHLHKAAAFTIVKIAAFYDKNNNNRLDKGEDLIPWAGISVSIVKDFPDQTINLEEGWNLITLPGLPNKPLTASTFIKDVALQQGYVTTVSALDNGVWKTYVKRADTDYSGEDFLIEPSKAYFVKVIKPLSYQFAGSRFLAPIKTKLTSGWNAVGVSNDKYTRASKLIEGVNGKNAMADVVSKWENSLWDSMVLKKEKYGTDFAIERGRGYLIRLKQPGEYEL